MISRGLLIRLLPLALLAVVAIAVRAIVLGSTPMVNLKAAPSLTGIVSQSLAAAGPKTSLPVVGKDFELQNIHYLDNKSWVVASVKSISDNPSTSTIVMRQVDTDYQVVLGPGTAFSVNSSQAVPADVIKYLKTVGVVIYVPSAG